MCYTGLTVYGDSIGKGVIWSEALGRYKITRESCVRLLSERLPYPVENRSRMGCTVRQCLENLDPEEIKPGQLVVFEFGSNDSDMDWEAVSKAPKAHHEPSVPIGDFESDLTRLVRIARSRGAYPMLTTPIPLNSQRYLSWVSRNLEKDAILQYLGDAVQMARWQERWSHAVERVAFREHVPLIDLRDAMLRCLHFDDLYCRDGIHPNEEGQKYLFETVCASFFPEKASLDKAG